MKKLKLSPVLAAGVAAAVQMNQGQALAQSTIVTYTNTTVMSGNSFEVTFPTIDNADELLSISEGAAEGGESGSFTLLADYSGDTQQTVYASGPKGVLYIPYDTVTDKTFTEGSIDGLTFEITGYGNVQSLPVGTVFTFEVAPEPGTLSLVAAGAGGLWLAARRRAGKQS